MCHMEAFGFYRKACTPLPPLDVCELGSRIVFGTARAAYPHARSWVGVDIADGPGVDVVADAASFDPGRQFGVVICAEVFEHTAAWPQIVANARRLLKPGGIFLASCASRQRPPHSAVDGGDVRDGEWYANVGPAEMTECLTEQGWASFEVLEADGAFGDDDLYVRAVR